MRAIGPLAFAQRAEEIGKRPAADAGLRMRRDVRAIESTERRLQRATAGVWRGVLALFGMAAEAAGRFRQILTALRVALRKCSACVKHKNERNNRGDSSQKS